MSELDAHLANYLRLRRALGFKLEYPGQVLPQFLAYLQAQGATRITAEHAIAWAGLPKEVLPVHLAHRLGAVRGFARYVKAIDPKTEVPPVGVWSATTPRRTPYVFSQGDLADLIAAARRLPPAFRGATSQTLFGLLISTGMRVGETLALHRGDVDLIDGVLTIREAKFDRCRIVPLHESTTAALAAYATVRDKHLPYPQSDAFFLTDTGKALRYNQAHQAFVEVTTTLGLRSGTVQPRIHDLRHRFTISTLLAWHQAGMQPGNQMAVLATYLGHVHPASTYWYLTATPELMELVAARLIEPGRR
jgi:integrase